MKDDAWRDEAARGSLTREIRTADVQWLWENRAVSSKPAYIEFSVVKPIRIE